MKIYKIKQTQATEELSTGAKVYIGIDMHQKSWHITVLHEGAVIFSGNIPAGWTVFEKLLARYRHCDVHTAYEAGCFGFWLHDRIIAWGAHCIVTPPSLLLIESGNRVKTDRRDSKKLALHLWKGLLKAVFVPTEEQRAHRTVIRRRRQLVQDRVSTQLRIKSELRLHDIPFPDIRGRWSKEFVERLHCLKFTNHWLEQSFKALLTELDNLNAQIEQQTKLIQELAKTDPYRDQVALLRTIPGIGILIAMEILVELHDMRRFSSSAQLAAYVGLTPSQNSSGDRIRLGRITRMGKSHLRALLVEASWILIGKDPVLGKKYQALKLHGGSKKAIVAIARKLLVRARRVLLDRTPYVVAGRAA